ncbi:MAG: MFS transporter [Candidatus Cohnella colombiensis]|uniref:MFS transporter n=1 Tax=Candidatus Cohnella colombiensis TaxID=3121368 RepID=A0AA95JHD5_9BACL|nr:MAG: MFS transporter [Cohnella sp.]
MSERSYNISQEKQQQLYKRSLLIVVISQIFGGTGFAAGITVGALLAQDMLGTDSYAGVPTALFTLGAAATAFFVGQLTQRFGRRAGLATGFITGGVGAIGVIYAAIYDNLFLLFASLLVYGAGSATNLLARYAGTDLAKPTERARAISIAMVSTTLGAVAGPNLVQVMGRFASSINVPELAGPFILAAAAFIMAGLVIILFLRPDPFIVAKMIAVGQQNPLEASLNKGSEGKTNTNKGVIVGASIMVITQIVMVAIMTMTPIHMKHHGHSLGDVGLVIGIHIGAMFLPSLLTGILVDRFGRKKMVYASGITLLLSGIVAAIAPPDSMALLIIALALLGIGWNFGLISGTALIVDATTVHTRAKTQGTIDVFIAIFGSIIGALSGVFVVISSYATLALVGGFLSLALIPVMVWSKKKESVNEWENIGA